MISFYPDISYRQICNFSHEINEYLTEQSNKKIISEIMDEVDKYSNHPDINMANLTSDICEYSGISYEIFELIQINNKIYGTNNNTVESKNM
jgi:hypothetical protein